MLQDKILELIEDRCKNLNTFYWKENLAKDIMDIIAEERQEKKEAAAKTRNENKFYYKYGR